MKRLSCSLILALILAVPAIAASPYDFMLTGICQPSRMWWRAYSGTLHGGTYQELDTYVENLAEAPGGRVFGFRDFRLVEVRPDRTIVPLLPDVQAAPYSPVHMVVAADGTTFLMPDSATHLRAIASNGAVRNIAIPPSNWIQGGIDLASDQCTLYYVQDARTIKRLNVCTETSLPDFVTVSPYVSDVRVLPDGGVLLAQNDVLLRYDATGILVRTYPVVYPTAIGLSHGGTVAYVTHGGCDNLNIERIDLASGAMTTIPFERSSAVDIVPFRSWTAALGAHVAGQVPTASTTALAIFAVLIALAAFVRLR